jgi:hypothetical protein
MPTNKRCLDFLLLVSLTSFVSITLPVTITAIYDYRSIRSYSPGICNGSTLSNYTVGGGFFFYGTADVVATVNNTQYSGVLYYPPLKHWQLGFMPRMGIDDWYDSLNKTGTFKCFVDLRHNSHPMVNEWIEITGYYTMFVLCLIIMTGSIVVVTLHSKQKSRPPQMDYLTIPDELPPPYTPKKTTYQTLNDELVSISV